MFRGLTVALQAFPGARIVKVVQARHGILSGEEATASLIRSVDGVNAILCSTAQDTEGAAQVLVDMNLGKTRTEAFHALRDRLADDEITNIVGAILQGEHLGTPLGKIFRTQADVLRLKRTQRAETVAGEAGVNMLLPGVMVMASTVLVILGPFLLNYLAFGLNM